MFYPIENGSIVEIPDNCFGFTFVCHLPPIGYGKNVVNGKIQKTDILKRSDIPEEQYWERPKLPDDYKKKRELEAARQKIDKEYYDPYLEDIRRTEWKRRLLGVWFWNYNPYTKESELQYITGTHYFKLTHWQFKKNFFFDFRISDRNFWYVMRYCEEDPNCLGLNDIEKRKGGKCFGKDTPIRMYDGTIKMVQDICDGELVMGDDSTPRTVSGATTGIENLYLIKANKGDSFICNESHILALQWNGSEYPTLKGWRKGDKINISVKEYLQLREWEKDHLVLYRRGWGRHYQKRKHFIPSYMMGVFLGDGHHGDGAITTTDTEIYSYVESFANSLNLKLSKSDKITYRLAQKGAIKSKYGTSFLERQTPNPYRSELKRLNLIKNKHIPYSYLKDCEANRLELLAGLIDTDGYLCKDKGGQHRSYEITQKNEKLSNDICELCRSLGFFVSKFDKKATMKRKDGSVYSSTVYRICIYGDIHRIPCKIERKKSDTLKRRKDSLCFGFKIIEQGIGEYFGFEVDGNHLFLLADGTVVHNTARSGVWLYDRTSRMENQHGTIQSKSDDDAADVFKKAVVHPWKLLPHFFRPIYDLMKGDDPSETLNFFNTSRRGATAEQEQTDEALNSFIDFFAAQEHSLDGPEIDTLVADEAGKTKKPVDIKERQNIVRYCSEIDGKFAHRRQLYTTTVEPDKNEPENYEFQEMTAQSNPMKRDANGRTGTGLYTYFVPAQISMFADKYGYPDVEGATIFLLNTRKKYEEDGDTRALSSFKRKNPMNFKEAFSADGEFALYDPERLNNQLDAISWNDQLTEKGNLEWEGGIPFKLEVDVNGVMQTRLNKIIWVPMENGRWEKIKGWWPKDANKVYENNGKFLPNNNFAFRIGCDPFKYDKAKDKRRSKCSAFAYQMPDALAKDDICNDALCLRYCYRRESKRLSNEDILKMCWLCGCQVLFERNVDHWKDDFKEWNCDGFLMYLPGEVEPGIYTDGAGTTTQLICNYTESYINEHCHKVLFKTLLRKDTGWLGFKVEDTQTFDEPMGAGLTFIAVKGKRYSRPVDYTQNIEDIMPLHKATA